MLSATYITLLSLGVLTRLDILIWVVAVPLLLGFVLLLLYQRRQHKVLQGEVEQLAKVKRHNIEYELVLKAMKLSTWRVDVATQGITFESDYREHADNVVFPVDAKLDDVFRLVIEPHRSRARRNMDDLLAGRTDNFHEQYQIRIPHSDNTYWAETFATIDKRDLEGRPQTIVGTTMRIDRQKQAEQDLIEARNHAEESDRLKSAFLANMTHEIRTPLNAIVGFSDLLQVIEGSDDRREFIRIIRNNCDMLLRLINDIIEASNMNQGSMAIEENDVDFATAFNDICQTLAQRVEEPGVQFVVENPYVEFPTRLDKGRMQQVITNFTTNAVKYTHQGHIKVGYYYVTEQQLAAITKQDLATLAPQVLTDGDEAAQRHGIYMYCEDTGAGIPKEKQASVFERFVKLNDYVQGTGLGLSICKSIADRYEGHIGVSSEGEGHGSTFWIWIPCPLKGKPVTR